MWCCKTLSYRKASLSRIKERNVKRIEDCIRLGKVRVIFNSIPTEIREDAVVLDVNGELQEIPNDYVWIFAGGLPPNDFLRKIGVDFGMRDMTLEASREAHEAAAAKRSTPA